MYLVDVDTVSGLVKVEGSYDGLMFVKEFREVVNDPMLGVECMTCIALVADWLTPIRYYTERDRPIKAMRNVMNNGTAFIWKQKKIQEALIKYKELQYNPALVEKNTLDSMLIEKLNEIKKEKNKQKQIDLFNQLSTIKELLKSWNKQNEDINPYADGPIEGGYPLSRLEEKLKDRNSFYNV